VSNAHRRFIVPWAKKVEDASNGRISIRIFPSMQLGGTPPQLFDQARDGVADIVWTLPGYTAGRFLRLEAIEVPFVAAELGVTNSRAAQEFATTYAKEDLAEVHPICVWANDGGLIHTKRQVKTMEDLKGLKLRFPTRLAGKGLEALGASPIGMPVPQVPESLAQGVLDGAVVPWEVVPGIKLHELVKYHVAVPGAPTFYSSTFLLAMNKGSYDRLPADLRAVIDAHSGDMAATMAGQAWDIGGAEARALAEKRGNSVATISEEEKARWIKACQPVAEAWIAEMKGKGIDGGKLLEAARALVAKYNKA
jgi:TRAP-type C4-dicarboxylate transport system substrate-binding protein